MSRFLLILFLVIGSFLRFYNLNWGAPYYFHPDERNIASSVTQINFPTQMNPHFFAYGSLPIYTIYFTGLIMNFFSSCKLSIVNCELSFSQAILISRFYSAIFSMLLIPLLYILGTKLNDQKTGLLAAFLGATSIGFIQFSHFGTFEMWLTFFGTLLFYICLKLIHAPKTKTVLLAGIVCGILVSIKISSLPLLVLPFIAVCITYLISKHHLSFLARVLIFLESAFIVFTLTSPFTFLDFPSFKSGIQYESSVAFGTLPVFYTGGFKHTIPILYQFLHVYPFILNPFITILFIPSFFYFLLRTFKTKSPTFFLLNFFFLILFLSQAFFYAKWIRYMIPTLPFMYLMIAYALSSLRKTAYYYTSIIVVIVTVIFSSSYFITAFVKQDTRIQAAKWAKKHIPSDVPILSEVYDLGITAFNADFTNITLFNFYDLDNNSPDYNQQALREQLRQNTYLVLPSQRILKNRLINSRNFPQGYKFYHSLVNGKLGFTKIYQTPCDIFCNIIYLGNPIFSYEETANVFDRPIVFIYKKV